jgi:hypothetical protein
VIFCQFLAFLCLSSATVGPGQEMKRGEFTRLMRDKNRKLWPALAAKVATATLLLAACCGAQLGR